MLITDPNNPDNRSFYDRANRGPRLSIQSNGRDMPFGNFATDITTDRR